MIHHGGPARLVYLGSPEIAVAPLDALVEAGHDVALVVTNPDRRRGRGRAMSPTPVKAAAERLAIPVSHDLDDVTSVDASFGVVVAYGHIIGTEVLDALPFLNIHFSLLPRWRGAAPLERAILAGDEETGVCLMEIVEALDEGGIYGSRRVPIGDSTLQQLRTRLIDESCQLLVQTLQAGLPNPAPQVGEPIYARKISADEYRLDFGRPADELLRIVRLGRAWTTLDGARFRILEAHSDSSSVGDKRAGSIEQLRVATASGWLVLDTVQPEGKRGLPAHEWLRGSRLDEDAAFGV